MNNVVSIKPAVRIAVDLGQAEPNVEFAARLELEYPGHLVLIQAGKFLQGFNRCAYALNRLKDYRIKLAGPFDSPHLAAGFPVAGFKAKLWPLLQEKGIPYVVALGSSQTGYELELGNPGARKASMLDLITNDVVDQVMVDLLANRDISNSKSAKALANPDAVDFIFKTEAIKLADLLVADICNLPRNIRSTWGESVRTCLDRLLYRTYLYGNEPDKLQLLREISADIDLLKHYLTQALRLDLFKLKFEHRAGLVVELGRIAGGLIRAKVKP